MSSTWRPGTLQHRMILVVFNFIGILSGGAVTKIQSDVVPGNVYGSHEFRKWEAGTAPPDLHSQTWSPELANKLGQLHLGDSNRIRRDEKDDLLNDVKTAEVETAEAALEAEEAKDSSVEALLANSKVAEDLQTAKDTLTIPSLEESESTNVTGGSSSGNGKPSVTEIVVEAHEDDYDDDYDDDDAEETIVEDEVITIKTTDVDSKPKVNHNGNDTNQSPESPGSSDNSEGVSVCQGLLDFKRMSDDFRERLQELIEREEQVVDRLEQIQTSWENNPPGGDSAGGKIESGGSSSNVQPSKACVYIDENVNAGPVPSGASVGVAQESQKVPQPPQRSSIKIYTQEGVYPKGQSQNGGFNSGSGGAPIPVMQARLNAPGHEPSPGESHRFVAKKKKTRQSEDDAGSGMDENHHPTDIDLENIYWIKPAGLGGSSGGDSTKYQNVIEQLQAKGQDVLIIPISAKLRNIREVANSFLESVRAGKVIKKRQTDEDETEEDGKKSAKLKLRSRKLFEARARQARRRFKMTIRRI